jgi:hypothetical protein
MGAALRSLDDAAFAGLRLCQREGSRQAQGDLDQQLARLVVTGAGLEDLAQRGAGGRSRLRRNTMRPIAQSIGRPIPQDAIGAWLTAAAKRPGAMAVRTPT